MPLAIRNDRWHARCPARPARQSAPAAIGLGRDPCGRTRAHGPAGRRGCGRTPAGLSRSWKPGAWRVMVQSAAARQPRRFLLRQPEHAAAQPCPRRAGGRNRISTNGRPNEIRPSNAPSTAPVSGSDAGTASVRRPRRPAIASSNAAGPAEGVPRSVGRARRSRSGRERPSFAAAQALLTPPATRGSAARRRPIRRIAAMIGRSTNW